jgi:hypothetical protein
VAGSSASSLSLSSSSFAFFAGRLATLFMANGSSLSRWRLAPLVAVFSLVRAMVRVSALVKRNFGWRAEQNFGRPRPPRFRVGRTLTSTGDGGQTPLPSLFETVSALKEQAQNSRCPRRSPSCAYNTLLAFFTSCRYSFRGFLYIHIACAIRHNHGRRHGAATRAGARRTAAGADVGSGRACAFPASSNPNAAPW